MFALCMVIGLVFSVVVYNLAVGMDWHWGFAVFLALVPIGAAVFMGIFGVIGSALFVGAMFKASAAS